MTPTRSLQRRLGLTLGVLLTVLWIGATWVTAILARQAMDELFDSALQETAQRILPLAVAEVLAREGETAAQRQALVRDHEELLTYAVRDGQGRFLLLSHDADPTVFPPSAGTGFSQSATHRFYDEAALQGSVRITVAEPLAHRTATARRIRMGLGLPLLVMLPLSLLAVVLGVRTGLAPLRRFRERLGARGTRDLSQVPAEDLPTELAPLADTLNRLLGQLSAAFEAERSFAANAAHELRTPLAGAIAQVQRLKAETSDSGTRSRAADIEATLKRLTRLSEQLLQLARAEGARLRLDRLADLRPVARIVTDALSRGRDADRVVLTLPLGPVMSDLDPDVFAIVCRNLVENALRHGPDGSPVSVSLDPGGVLTVANDGPVVPVETLGRLTERFERGTTHGEGSGLGLAIVRAITQRIGSALVLRSPRAGQATGFEATVTLPIGLPPLR